MWYQMISAECAHVLVVAVRCIVVGAVVNHKMIPCFLKRLLLIFCSHYGNHELLPHQGLLISIDKLHFVIISQLQTFDSCNLSLKWIGRVADSCVVLACVNRHTQIALSNCIKLLNSDHVALI